MLSNNNIAFGWKIWTLVGGKMHVFGYVLLFVYYSVSVLYAGHSVRVTLCRYHIKVYVSMHLSTTNTEF